MNMTNSPTLSPSDKEKLELFLRGFLEGKYPLEVMEKLLHAYIVFDFTGAPARREIGQNKLDGRIKIEVDESHLRNMLDAYLANRVSESDLSNWAAFVFMSQVFVPQGGTEEERWESGDGPVWDILQRLMTPSIFGGLGPEVVKGYLDLLS